MNPNTKAPSPTPVSHRFAWAKRPATLVVILVLALILGGAILLIPRKNTPKKAASTTEVHPVAVVTITKDGFVPSTLQIQTGTRVVWVNKDVMPHQVAANPYPTHADLPALFAKQVLAQDQTYSFLFTKTRSVDYHDELNPTVNGTVEVK